MVCIMFLVGLVLTSIKVCFTVDSKRIIHSLHDVSIIAEGILQDTSL